MIAKKRFETGTKYKGKFIILYETLLKEDDLSTINQSFWDEFFLIKPIVSYIENEINRLDEETLIRYKKNINILLWRCINVLNDENIYRIVYSMQNLTAVLLSLFKKANYCEKRFNFIDVSFGLDNIQERIKSFLQYSNVFLTGEYPINLKSLFIKAFLVITTGMDNINENILLDYIMNGSTFESLIQVLRNTISRGHHGYNILLILTLFVNYRKYESTNPIIVKLSILDDELALNGYGQVISSSLFVFCKNYVQLTPDIQISWLTSLTSIIGNIFIGDEETKIQQIRQNNALLLALYEVTHLNRNFITTLAYTQSDVCSQIPLNTTLYLNQLLAFQVSDNASQPFNLLAIFFQYCSVVIHVAHSEIIFYNVKLCFLILCCISEDQYANSLMHDGNLSFKVQLHKTPMHHRKSNSTILSSQPLAATLLDLMVEFIATHMMKKFPLELYNYCIGILLRMLCYQKRCRVRLNYQWINLWTVLINLLKFLVSHESCLVKRMNIFTLATKVVNILNIFITYGDMFLLLPSTYDQLFYEIIRMKLIFINLNSLGLRYSNCETYEYKYSAYNLTNALINLRDILNHFSPKISEWLTIQNISTPTEKQIMTIIIQHYDSLTLKLQDNLDQFESYSENPRHSEFFYDLVKNIIITTRSSFDLNLLDAESILQEYRSSSLNSTIDE